MARLRFLRPKYGEGREAYEDSPNDAQDSRVPIAASGVVEGAFNLKMRNFVVDVFDRAVGLKLA